MSGPRRLVRLVEAAPEDAVSPPGSAGETVVLDPAWTAADRDAALAIRPIARRVLEGHDPHGEALALVDSFADQAGLDDALSVGEVSLWPRRRLVAWRRLHDLILWRGIVAELGLGSGAVVAGDELPHALADLLGVVGVERASGPAEAAAVRTNAAPRPAPHGLARRLARRARTLLPAASAATPPVGDPVALERSRLEPWFAAGRRPLLVLTDSGVHQLVDTADGPRRMDPFLGTIVERLRGTTLEPVTVDLASAPPADDRTIRARTITATGDEPDDRAAADGWAREASARLGTARASVGLDGVDVGGLLLDAERGFAADGVAPWAIARARIERFLTRHRPAAILLINEYGRPEWVSAAHRQGIPVAAVQHGLIHRRHAGYVLPRRSPGLALPDRTYVFGDFERRLLTSGVYRDDEVRVGGSPRLDLLAAHDAGRTAAMAAADRDAIRAELGAHPGERLVVLSSTNNADIRRLVVAPALEAILDRPLPDVRIVVKLHPAEAPHDLYERLAAGLASAGGFEPPPVSVIRDVDLFTLLRAADAHLGIHSTVLSDAVVVGVRNLVVVGFPGSDLLDYVARGVARPVRDGGDLLAALAEPPPAPDDAARAAFLADQVRPGDAGARIADDLLAWLGG